MERLLSVEATPGPGGFGVITPSSEGAAPSHQSFSDLHPGAGVASSASVEVRSEQAQRDLDVGEVAAETVAGLARAVIVTAPRRREPEISRDGAQLDAHPRAVLLVVDFDAIQPAASQLGEALVRDTRAPLAIARVGDDGNPSSVADGGDGVLDGRSVALDVGRTAFVQEPREGLVIAGGVPGPHHSGSNVLPARYPPGQGGDELAVHREVQLVESVEQGHDTVLARRRPAREDACDHRVLRIEVVAEQVLTAALVGGGKLDPQHDPDTQPPTGIGGVLPARDGVVIGECDDIETSSSGTFDQLPGVSEPSLRTEWVCRSNRIA